MRKTGVSGIKGFPQGVSLGAQAEMQQFAA